MTKSRPDDKGEWFGILSLDRSEGRIHLDFGKALSWIAMTPKEARALSRELYLMAEKLDLSSPPAESEAKPNG